MESAIPDHLQCPRTRHRRIPDDYAPPYPAAVARYKPDVKQVVMAYFGAQYLGEPLPNRADKALMSIAGAFGNDKGPGHWDRALYVDEAGFTNIISIGYWDIPAEFDAWFGNYGAGWTNTAGMNFLRDDGLQIGCFVNRYMTVVDGSYRPAEKTFGMSWWKSLAALERWAESHPKHLAIFGAAMKYLGTMGPAANLKLYHEVTVAAADEQYFEYYNCHPKTGMLRTAASVG